MTTRRGLLGFIGLGAALPLLPKAVMATPVEKLLASASVPSVGEPPFSYVWKMGDRIICTGPVLKSVPLGRPGEGVVTCTVTDNRGFTTQTPVAVDFTIDEPEADEADEDFYDEYCPHFSDETWR